MRELGVLGRILGGKTSPHYIRTHAVMRQVLTGLTCNHLMDFDQIVANYLGEGYQAHFSLLLVVCQSSVNIS